MDRTDRILEIAYGSMTPDQLIALGATMDEVVAANDLLLMDQELEEVAEPLSISSAFKFIDSVLRHLGGR